MGYHDLIGQQIVHVGSAQRAGITKIAYLHWRGSLRENSRAGADRVPVQVDRDVDLQITKQLCRLGVAAGRRIVEVLESAAQAASYRRARSLRLQRDGVHFKFRAIMFLQDPDEDMCDRMITQIRRYIGDADSTRIRVSRGRDGNRVIWCRGGRADAELLGRILANTQRQERVNCFKTPRGLAQALQTLSGLCPVADSDAAAHNARERGGIARGEVEGLPQALQGGAWFLQALERSPSIAPTRDILRPEFQEPVVRCHGGIQLSRAVDLDAALVLQVREVVACVVVIRI